MPPRFEIFDLVHRSAFSTVERALDHQSGSVVALKRPLQPGPHWQREALAFDRIPPHANLIRRLDEGSDERSPFRVLEWITGSSLDSFHTDEPHARSILRSILHGLAAIHDAGFIHGDLSPANVLLPTEGEAKLIDLGTATPIADATPNLVGSIHCMAPERFDNAPPSIASDLYAIGVIACHLLSGRYPFEGDTTAQIITAHHRQQRQPLHDQCPVTPALEAWIDHLLARDPAQRPSSAHEADRLLSA